MIDSSFIHYEYNKRGYMLYYKGKSIGGAGIEKSAKGCRSNLKLFREQAERDIQSIINGYNKRYINEINKIERGKYNEREEP